MLGWPPDTHGTLWLGHAGIPVYTFSAPSLMHSTSILLFMSFFCMQLISSLLCSLLDGGLHRRLSSKFVPFTRTVGAMYPAYNLSPRDARWPRRLASSGQRQHLGRPWPAALLAAFK